MRVTSKSLAHSTYTCHNKGAVEAYGVSPYVRVHLILVKTGEE
jgi:hypothetical protein